MNQTVTLPKFAAALAATTAYKEEFCERFVADLFKFIEDCLRQDGRVVVKGIGEFRFDNDSKLMYMPDSSLADTVNAPFDCFESIELDDDFTEEMLSGNPNETVTTEKEESIVLTNDENPASAGSVLENLEPKQAIINAQEEIETKESLDTPHTVSQQVSERQKEAHATEEPDMAKPDENEEDNDWQEANDLKTEEETTGEETIDENKYQNYLNSENYSEPETKRRHTLVYCLISLLLGLAIGAAFGIFLYPEITGNKTEPTATVYQHNDQSTDTATKEIAESDNIESDQTDKKQSSDTIESVTAEESNITTATPPVITETVTATNYLASMARRHYGRFEFWVYIYEENRDKLGDPDKIEPQTTVIIPPAEKYGIDKNDQASIDQAIAKSKEIYSHFGK